MSQDGGKKKGAKKTFEETLQVRVRAKNPLIERKPSERDDSHTAAGFDPPGRGDSVTVAEMPESVKRSIYEELEQTDRTEEIRAAAAELAEAPAKEPMMLEETRELVMEERADPPPPPAQTPQRRAQKGKPKKKSAAPPAEWRGDSPTAPRPKAAALMDEDETIVALGPPQRAGDLEQAHRPDADSEEAPTFVPTPTGAGSSDVPTQRPQAVVVKRSVPAPAQQEETPEDPSFELDVVPRRMLGAPGTHGAGAEVQRQMVNRIDRELPAVAAPALKILRAELGADALQALDDALAGKYDHRAADGSVSPKRALEHLINEKSYNALTPKDRAKLLGSIADDPRDVATIKAGIAVLKTRLPERLRDHERSTMLDLFARLDTDGRASLAQVAARRLRGRSALEDKDLRDASLVDRLTELLDGGAVADQLRSRGVKRERMVALVLATLASPEKLPFEEGSSGVLSTLEFALADCSPAEYTRIWSELLSRFCTAELAGDAQLELGRRLEASGGLTTTPLRFALEQLPELAHPRGKKKRSDFVMPGGHGVDADVVSRALALVYGVGFTVAAGPTTVLRHLERVPRDPQRVPPVFVSLLYERGERLFVFDHMEDGTVFLRAPHGRSSKRAGAFRTDPVRAVVDPERGLESVPFDDFEEWAGVGLVPRL